MQTKYRDYFSLKTLARYGVSPDEPLPLDGAEVKADILAAFGNVSEEERATLSHKTDCALFDLHLLAPEEVREAIEVEEAVDEREPLLPESAVAPPAVERGRTL